MLNEDFCSFLEYHLSKCFKYTNDESLKSFWCDGVALPLNENSYSEKSINDKRQVLLSAFIGEDGQDEYTMLLKFGNKSLSRYARGLDIKDCVPTFEKNDWYIIDKKNKQITIQLI